MRIELASQGAASAKRGARRTVGFLFAGCFAALAACSSAPSDATVGSSSQAVVPADTVPINCTSEYLTCGGPTESSNEVVFNCAAAPQGWEYSLAIWDGSWFEAVPMTVNGAPGASSISIVASSPTSPPNGATNLEYQLSLSNTVNPAANPSPAPLRVTFTSIPTCSCQPACNGSQCGVSDGCGGTCGCDKGGYCESNACVYPTHRGPGGCKSCQ